MGGIAIPRIGQEVILDFIEGDPDQPIITGRTYHSVNTPPYSLPANKTRMSIKSQTHKGQGFNELRFEDENGKQEVFIHAQKDQNNIVRNDETTQVGQNRGETVGQNDILQVGLNRQEQIGGYQVTQVGKDILIQSLTGDISLGTAAGNITLTQSGQVFINGKNVNVVGTEAIHLNPPGGTGMSGKIEAEPIDDSVWGKTKKYMGRVASGEIAKEGLDRYGNLLERMSEGDTKATEELAMEMMPLGGITKIGGKMAGKAGKGGKNGGFKTHGLDVDPISIPEGRALMEELARVNPKLSNNKIRELAKVQLASGKEVPIVRAVMPDETLYKIVPKGDDVSGYTPYFTSKKQLDALKENPGNVSDTMGLPKSSEAVKYDVYQIKPQKGKTPKVFDSKVASTTEGQVTRKGGGDQTIVPNRPDWTTPEKVGEI